jgi:hypothetical protein
MTVYADPMWDGVSSIVGSEFSIWTGQSGSEEKRLTVDVNGLVGIGMSPVNGYALSVAGSIWTTGVQYNFNPGVSTQAELVNRNGAGFDFYTNNATLKALSISAAGALTLAAGGLVSFGANDSGGAGKRLMLVPNA